MEIIFQYFDAIYIYLIGILLFCSWYFLWKSQYDERRNKRFMFKNMKRQISTTVNAFKVEKHDQFLKKYGFPSWLTSERINIFRYSLIFLVVVLIAVGFLSHRSTVDFIDALLLGGIALMIEPKEKMPLHWIALAVNKKRQNHISNEVYQLYNDLKVTYQDPSYNKNMYYQIQELLAYYTLIKPTLEKMLPFLERQQQEEAWTLFAKELDIQEASMLSVMMQEIGSLKPEQALQLLEQKRKEFSNNLYNRYTDMLRRQKSTIYVLVMGGAVTVFFNEITVFFMWYKEVMSVVNQL